MIIQLLLLLLPLFLRDYALKSDIMRPSKRGEEGPFSRAIKRKKNYSSAFDSCSRRLHLKKGKKNLSVDA